MKVWTSAQLAPLTLPTCQKRKELMTFSRGITMMLTSDENAVETAVPASASLSGEAPPRPLDPTP